MSAAVITLSDAGARLARRLATELTDCQAFVHRNVKELPAATRFDGVCELTADVFGRYRRLIYIMPTGVVIRAIVPHLRHKATDPAVVAMDVGGRWAVSLLGGHEGGANKLAMEVANLVGAEAVISTTTEAAKSLIVGVGCRRGTSADAIVAAIQEGVKLAGSTVDSVRVIASADIKKDEAGLIEAANRLGVPLRLIDSGEIRQCARSFTHSKLAQKKVNLPAVAEPAALLAGRRTQLLLPRQTIAGVTVAVAREDCWSLA